ncbi:MAG TPA: VOC family protein [Acidimicrobiales bacterium]|nr:VOC family protein [Acidimicrobiales bacterium]
MEVTKHDPGTPSWADLGSPDLDASIEFYSGLFGWQIDKGPEEAGGYSMAMLRGKPVAGIGPLMSEGQPPSWSTYVSVADIEETAEKVRDNGGQVFLEPMKVEIGSDHFGSMGVFADPTGAVFSAWEPHQHIGAGLVMEPGALVWNELVTRDIDVAKKFYASVFGWQGDTNDAGPTTYTEWKLGGRAIGGMLQMNEEWPLDIPAHWMTYFAVADADDAAEKAKELGATLRVPPTDIPNVGRFAVVVDPAGAQFSVMAMNVS